MATALDGNDKEQGDPRRQAPAEWRRNSRGASPTADADTLEFRDRKCNPPAATRQAEVADPNASMLGWKYRRWIEALKAAGGHFVTAADILDGNISSTTCNLLVRHDIDQCELYANVWPLLAIEYRFGVRSTTYLFAANDPQNWTQRRKGLFWLQGEPELKCRDQLLRYQAEGFEFGLHVDVVGRCRRRGNTVDSREALDILERDLARLRWQGIRVRTMAAHGFAWPDGVRSWYDNYAAEFDYTAGGKEVQSQFHVLERFAEKGQPASARLGLDRMKRMKSIWLPRHVPFGWLHAENASQLQLHADVLTLTDAGACWKYLGLRELASLVPRLPGCLVILNVHPIYYAYGDDGLEFLPHKAQFDDHRWLADQRAIAPSMATGEDAAGSGKSESRLVAVRYSGRLDFDRIGPDWVSARLAGDGLQRLNRKLRQVNARLKGGPWFDRLIQSPNAAIIAWLDEFIDPAVRPRLRVIEVCGGVGPVAIGLTHHGFRPENMAVTDFDPKHLAMAAALNRSVTGGKMRVFPLDVRDVTTAEQFDIVVLSSWENTILPYDQVTAQCQKLLADSGLLVMTFLEKSRIESEGYDYFPDRLIQNKTYSTIAADELAAIFDRHGLEPICYLDHGYPKVRFPRHILVGRKRGNVLAVALARGKAEAHGGKAKESDFNEAWRPLFAALQQASQRYFDELRRLLAAYHGEASGLPPWSFLLNIGPLAQGKQIEGLPPADRVRLLSLAVRKATCHPFGPWDLDYSRSGFGPVAVLAGLLVGHGNKCGAVAGLTRSLLELHGVRCRTIHCSGQMPDGEMVQHSLNEVLLDGRWRLLDNDVFQFCDSFFTNDDGSLMTRDEVLALSLGELIRRFPWPYTYRGFDYDPSWVERNWTAWRAAVGGTVRDLG